MKCDVPASIAILRELLPDRVHQLLVDHGEEGLTDQILLRWLTGRKFDVHVTAKDLAEHAEWRAHCVPGRRVQDDVVASGLALNVVFFMGLDRRNHPSLLLIGGNFVPQDPEQTTIFITYTLDAALHLGRLGITQKQEEARKSGVPMDSTWDGRIVGVFDMSNFGWSNMHYASQKAILRLLQRHYVERLYKIFIYCAPSIFHGLYQVLSLLLEENSRKKAVHRGPQP
ncbi:CRAL-TRIO domain-containing protein [Dunaliella salina]|uniref:CRAL-TRIO domain-containing protein n=1 Tax=Dunaliella salina TaxID=3046 RepID=A0ABQ7G8D7_DUNSA|nr:CRAL-TRIO domain-containing protein [Dunaliella salina]|eukprot:KAF5830881.1 CRAL-TRIO domain-containing protein [Dunaliella salina]